MNAPTVSAEAKARLVEAVKNYTPAAPEKYHALNEVKESIIVLRERKTSYETIRVMLHENAGIEVSHQTVARYCREMLKSPNKEKGRRSRMVADGKRKESHSAQPPVQRFVHHIPATRASRT